MSDADRKAAPDLSRVRHDLRTPLNQIIGYTEMLQEVAAEDLQADLAKIRTAALNLVGGVDRACEAFAAFAARGPAAGASSDALETTPAPREAMESLPDDGDRASTVNADAADTEGPLDEGAVAQSDSVAPRGSAILIVDDNEMNRAMLSRRLLRRGFQVETAEDGESALAILAERSFDLVLLDVIMPGLSGIDVLRRVRTTHTMAELPIIMATARDGSSDVVEALGLGANDYVTKPIDLPVLLARANTQLALREANERVRELAAQLEARNRLIREAFGRYLTDEVVAQLLETPDGLALGGESRNVTILMSDLRGFSAMSERLTPPQVVGVLNHYLGRMTEIIVAYGGTIGEFIGDAILVIFGAPVAHEDHAARAVACALEMQLAMAGVNEHNVANGLPEIEMGIGINSGEVVVGNIGSHRRAKYGVVGRNVNLASRIESYTVGGQVLVSESTCQAVGAKLEIAERVQVSPKGEPLPIMIYDIAGIGGDHPLRLPSRRSPLVELREPIAVCFALLDGVQASESLARGYIHSLSQREAIVRADLAVPAMTTVKLQIVGTDGRPSGADAYGKVLRASDAGSFVLHFTSVAPQIADAFKAALLI